MTFKSKAVEEEDHIKSYQIAQNVKKIYITLNALCRQIAIAKNTNPSDLYTLLFQENQMC